MIKKISFLKPTLFFLLGTLLFFFLSKSLYSKESSGLDLHKNSNKERIIHCLGKEEESLHQDKTTNPFFQLNQDLLNIIAETDLPFLREHYIKEICGTNPAKNSIALQFLEVFMTQRQYAFIMPSKSNEPQEHYRMIAQLSAFLSDLPPIFMTFLSSLQGHMPVARCLEMKIPDLKSYYLRIELLENESVPFDPYFHKKNLLKIFKEIRNIKSHYEACQKMVKKDLQR